MENTKNQIFKSLETWLSCNLSVYNYASKYEWEDELNKLLYKIDLGVIDKFILYASDADNDFNDNKFSIQDLKEHYVDIIDKASEIALRMLSENDDDI